MIPKKQTLKTTTDIDNKLSFEGSGGIKVPLYLEIPANTIVDDGGNIYEGEVTIDYAFMDPNDEKALDETPKIFLANGGEDSLYSYGMMTISITASDGTLLNTGEVNREQS